MDQNLPTDPPNLPLRFLRWFCKEEFLEEIEGDLHELYELRYQQSPALAKRKYALEVLRAFHPINFKNVNFNNNHMNAVHNYSKVYFRRFKKETVHYLVNIVGLALGLAVFFFIMLYVQDEKNIDGFHSKADRIYRVVEQRTGDDGTVQLFGTTANPLADAIKSDFPEVENTAKMIYLGSSTLKYRESMFTEREYAFTSASIFDILDIEIIEGNPKKEFAGPVGITISESTAKKLFGDKSAIGEMIDNPGRTGLGEVIAVFKDLPTNSSYQFKVLYVAAFERFPNNYARWFANWDSRGMTTWVLLKENASPDDIMANKAAFMEKYYPQEIRTQHDFQLQSIKDIHLGSGKHTSYYADILLSIAYSKPEYVYILLIIAIFIVTIATLNYVNLSSVQALRRSLEAGIRKVNGATISDLRFQLYVETFITLAIAYLLAILLLVLLNPIFLDLANKSISLAVLFTWSMLPLHLLFFVAIWALSSLVPSLYYSQFTRSLGQLKNVFTNRGDLMRKSFVVVQYGISIILIIGSIVLYRQLNYVQTKDLGFNNDGLIILDINSRSARNGSRLIVDALKTHPSVLNASVSSRVPGEWKENFSVGLLTSQDQLETVATHYAADQYWLDTYGMTLLQGSNFSGVASADTLKVILNEQAVQMMGLENPVGQSIFVRDDTLSRMKVIGIVKDFHFQSFHEPIGPVIITSEQNPIMGIDYFTIKYQGVPSDAIAHIEAVQKQFDPLTPAEINFLDQQWERYYSADVVRSNLIFIATLLSIIISTFGLFGLVNFTAERKTKEIGIRKVLGASVPNIIQIVLREYVLMLLIALLLASPIAYWVLQGWLEGFSYRINLSPSTFLAAFVMVLAVSFVTVILRVHKLAISNPVNALRSE